MKRKKRIFICSILSLMLALVMAVPMSVGATETNPDHGKQGLIDGTYYTTTGDEFKEAINNPNVECIRLMNDITVTGSVDITRNLMINTVDGTQTLTFTGLTDKENAIEILDGARVQFTSIDIKTDSGNFVVQSYGTSLQDGESGFTMYYVDIIHGGVQGGGILVNNGATGSAFDTTITVNPNSWYGVNVDSAKFFYENLKVIGAKGTQSVVCVENTTNQNIIPEVSRDSFTEVKTADGQTAYVNDENLVAFVKAKQDKNVTEINLLKNVKLSEPLFIDEEMTVNGGGFTITGPDGVNENAVTVTADGVILGNMTIATTADNKSVLHVYKAKEVLLQNLTLDNTETSAGAGLIVNSSDVNVSGELHVKIGDNSWGGINVDSKRNNTPASITFVKDSMMVFTTPSASKPAMYLEEGETAPITVTGAEEAGLKVAANDDTLFVSDNVNITGEQTDSENPGTNPVKPETGDQGQATGDKTTDNAPKTSDNMTLIVPAIALLAAVAAGTVVIATRRRHNN